MKRSHGQFTQEQVIAALKDYVAGYPVKDLLLGHGVAASTFDRWVRKAGVTRKRARTFDWTVIHSEVVGDAKQS